jgi:hypothetical protein
MKEKHFERLESFSFKSSAPFANNLLGTASIFLWSERLDSWDFTKIRVQVFPTIRIHTRAPQRCEGRETWYVPREGHPGRQGHCQWLLPEYQAFFLKVDIIRSLILMQTSGYPGLEGG